MNKKFVTIKEAANTGILSEYALRLMYHQGKLPCIMVGKKCLINYPLLEEQLEKESQNNGK